MMTIDSITVGMVQTNCYFVTDTTTKETLIIDPGAEEERILDYLKKNELKPCAILLTHGHFDHIMAVNGLRQTLSVKVYACEKEKALLEDAALNCSMDIGQPYQVVADVFCRDGEELKAAGFSVKVIQTPGHTAGSCCYHVAAEEGQEALFSGDTVFMESVGRCDLPTGNSRKIMDSLKKLLAMEPDLLVYPGHGPKTSIGYEQKNNPYAGW